MQIEVQDEHLNGLRITPERLRIEAAVGLYAGQDATLGQAAAIAGISQTEFLQELGRHGICVHYDVEDFEEDLKSLRSLRSK
jgi:predicted HTH domain antitoxin